MIVKCWDFKKEEDATDEVRTAANQYKLAAVFRRVED